MKPITIQITDDHTLLRDTWAFIFARDPRFVVVGVASTGEQAVKIAKQFNPDIVIMDINLPGMSGIDATEQIIKCSPSSKILAVTFHNDPGYVRKMIKVGAMGYITKNSSKDEMFNAIEEIIKGNIYVCKDIKNIITQRMFTAELQPSLSSLSKRELEIIESVKNGESSKEISKSLHISVKTVEVHRYNILSKLKLHNSASLINYVNNCQFI